MLSPKPGRNPLVSPQFMETLEPRMLLSTVFEPTPLDFFPDSSYYSDSRVVHVPEGGALVATGTGNDVRVIEIERSGRSHIRAESNQNQRLYGGTIAGYAFAADDFGTIAISGSFAIAGSPNDARVSGVGIFDNDPSTPDTVLYADSGAPGVSLRHIGRTASNSHTVLFTLRYTDGTLLDIDSIQNAKIWVRSEDGFERRATASSAPEGNLRDVHVTYSVSIPAHEPHESVLYTIEIDSADSHDPSGPSSVLDVAGNGAVSGAIASFHSAYVGTTEVPDVPDGDLTQLAWEPVGFKAFDFDEGNLAFSSSLGVVVPASRFDFHNGSYQTERFLARWDYQNADEISLGVDALSIDELHVTQDESDLVVLLTREAQGQDVTEIRWIDGPYGSSSKVIASSLDFDDLRRPTLGPDGEVIVFQAEPQGQSNTADTLYAAIRSEGWQTFRLLPVSNGVFEQGENWIDIDRDGVREEGPVATGYGSITGFEDFPLYSVRDEPMFITRPSSSRFDVYFKSSSDISVVRIEMNALGGAVLTESTLVGAPERILREEDFTHADEESDRIQLVGVSGSSNSASVIVDAEFDDGHLVFDAEELGQRPVLILPGIFGTQPTRNTFANWIVNRGAHPSTMEIDPLARTYHDLIQTLENLGYKQNQDLFVANYDWRVPPALPEPGPFVVPDGLVITHPINTPDPEHFLQGNFVSGIEYFRYWAHEAAKAWQAKHGVPLDEVDVIAHSTGGLVTRAYIQSDVYGSELSTGVTMPKVRDFLMVAVPNGGSPKAWNLLHNDFTGTNLEDWAFYDVVASSITWIGYKQIYNGRGVINNPDGTTISWTDVQDRARALESAAAVSNAGYANPDRNVRADHFLERAFIELYVPTLKSLLPVYDFLAPDPNSATEALININGIPEERNDVLLNLNGLTVGGIALTTAQTNTTVLFNSDLPTLDRVDAEMGFAFLALSNLGSDDLTDTGVPEPGNVRNSNRNEPWFGQEMSANGGVGDQTVPVISAFGQFTGDGTASFAPFTGLNHGSINYAREAQERMLRELFHRTDTVFLGGKISEGLSTVDNTAMRELGENYLYYRVVLDPVQGALRDSEGRRLGFDESEGILTEIPGSIFFGGADGIGFIFGDPGPVEFQLQGLGGAYYASAELFAGKIRLGGVESGGTLAMGQTTPSMPVVPDAVDLDDPSLPHRLYFPEGWRNDQTTQETITIFNPGSDDATVRLFAHYEHGQRDSLLAQLVIPAGERLSLNLADLGGRPDVGVRLNVGYALELQSDQIIAASVSRMDDFDPGDAVRSDTRTGAAFTNATANRWTFVSEDYRADDRRSFLVYFNPGPGDVTLTVTLHFDDGRSVEVRRVLGAFRRGGLALADLTDLPEGPFAIDIAASGPIVAAQSVYETDGRSGFMSLGTPVQTAQRRFAGIYISDTRSFELILSGSAGRLSIIAVNDESGDRIEHDLTLTDGTAVRRTGEALELESGQTYTLHLAADQPFTAQAVTKFTATGAQLIHPPLIQAARVWALAGENSRSSSLPAAQNGQIVLTNASDDNTQAEIDVFREGLLIETLTVELRSEASAVADLQDLLGDETIDVRDLAFRVRADDEILASLLAWDEIGGIAWSALATPLNERQ